MEDFLDDFFHLIRNESFSGFCPATWVLLGRRCEVSCPRCPRSTGRVSGTESTEGEMRGMVAG